ncbi:MAG: hypothetical protein LBR06_00090, partial [Bacteroidales bacterium]|nr:hypothetical protein [Bacteroidales bacterium]
MQNTTQNKMLSVKELNEVLKELHSVQHGGSISNLGTFSQVDIVFVAGLFLWYMQHRNNWTRIPPFFSLTKNANAYNHSHYFKQIEELYEIKHNDIFVDFENAQNKDANSFSRFFVPPIYITKQSIVNFFSYQNELETKWKSLFKLKEKYYKKFDALDFVNQTFTEFTSNEERFTEYNTEILQRLENASPILVFTFVVACKRLSQKEKRTIEQTKEYV